MVYSLRGNERYNGTQITRCEKSRQENFSHSVTDKAKSAHPPDPEFGKRLRDLLGEDLSNREILQRYGDILEVGSDSAVSNYLTGKRYPSVRQLIEISRIVKGNFHLLITGKGDPVGDPFEFLDKDVREAIQLLADIYHNGQVEPIIAGLLREGMRARLQTLLSLAHDARAEELRSLDVLYRFVRREAQQSAESADAVKDAGVSSPPARAGNNRR